MKKQLFVFSILTTLAQPVMADTARDIDQMSLEDIIHAPIVSSISKQQEQAGEAPGVVSVITASEITRLGIRNVSDAVAVLTGAIEYSSYFSEFSQIAIRGNFGTEHFNSKILCTVNGHPFYYPIHGGFELNAIPIDSIAQIELVRGPSSVMYGTNALTGMINIVTKQSSDVGLLDVKGVVGTHSQSEFRITSGKQIDDFRIFASATLAEMGGWIQTIGPDQEEGKKGAERPRYQRNRSVFLSIGYGTTTLDLMVWQDRHNSKIGLLPNLVFAIDDFEHHYFSGDLRHSRNIGKSIELHGVLRADYGEFFYYTNNLNKIPTAQSLPNGPVGIGADNYKVGGEIYAMIAPFENLTMTPGILYDQYGASPYNFSKDITRGKNIPVEPWTKSHSTSDLAVYINSKYKLLSSTALHGGVRYSHHSITDKHSDFRVGVVQNISPTLNVKLFYATAYRSPNYLELFTNSAPILQGNSNLEVEELRGVDLGLNYRSESGKIYAALGYYRSSISNLIRREIVNATPMYQNTAGTEIEGVEHEYKVLPLDWLQLFFNGNHVLRAKNKATGRDYSPMMNHSVNFGANFSLLSDALIFSVYENLRSDWGAAGGYALTNLSANYRLPEVNGVTYNLFAVVNNAFDKSYAYPENVRAKVATIPGGMGTNWLVGVQGRF